MRALSDDQRAHSTPGRRTWSGTPTRQFRQERRRPCHGAAMVLAGGVLIATVFGGPAGMLSHALGGFGGASIAARAGFTGMKTTLVAGASSGGISGCVQGTYGYYTRPGPHIISGALGATAQGTVFGAATGGFGGAAGQKISQKMMATVAVRSDAGTVAIGSFPMQIRTGTRTTRAHPAGSTILWTKCGYAQIQNPWRGEC